RAISVVAEKRTAALDPLGRERLMLGVALLWPRWVIDDSIARATAIQVAVVPVGAPFPDVAGHVEQTKSVCGKPPDGSGPCEAVGGIILVREGALPDIGKRGAVIGRAITP